jgi:hypothetical protein
MSTSVASGKHMESWRRERAEEKQSIIPTSKKARDSFNSFTPDMAKLEHFETKLQNFVEKTEDKKNAIEIEPVINVMGSTAGAGSGRAASPDTLPRLPRRSRRRVSHARASQGLPHVPRLPAEGDGAAEGL